jgi:hypothetical protein
LKSFITQTFLFGNSRELKQIEFLAFTAVQKAEGGSGLEEHQQTFFPSEKVVDFQMISDETVMDFSVGKE